MNLIFHEWNSKVALRSADGPVDDDVHLWIAAVPRSDSEMAAYARQLNESERSRAGRFKDHGARNEFVFGRGLLRHLLGAVLNRDGTTIPFDYGKNGKPRLADRTKGTDFRFNVSHSHSMVVIALAKGREVGVDIEWMERELDWPGVASRFFPEAWMRGWQSLPADQQRRAFFTAWTRKEAYLKATGEGLGGTIPEGVPIVDPQSPAAPIRWPMMDNPSGYWEFHEIPLPSGYAGTLVVGSPTQCVGWAC